VRPSASGFPCVGGLPTPNSDGSEVHFKPGETRVVGTVRVDAGVTGQQAADVHLSGDPCSHGSRMTLEAQPSVLIFQ